MLIDRPEQILFDFVGRYSESMTTLGNGILFASPWGRYPLNEPNADLLLDLLQHQQIKVYAQKYSLETDSSKDDHHKAQELADLVGKRSTASIFHAVHIYQGYEPLKRRNKYNALYYPDLKAYVRFGTLHPNKLLDMLGEDNVEGVVLFHDCADSTFEDRFFIFILGVQQSEFQAIMENSKEKQNEALIEAIKQAGSRGINIIPECPSDE